MVIASTPGWRIDRYLLRESPPHGNPDHDGHRRLGQFTSYNVCVARRSMGDVLVGAAERGPRARLGLETGAGQSVELQRTMDISASHG